MGIIDKSMGPAPAEEPSKGMMPEEEFEDGEAKDPEEYDKFMYVVESALADKKSKLVQKIASAIEAAADLPRILATTTYNLVAAMDEKTGGMLSDEDLPQAAVETLEHVAGIAEAAGKDVSDQVISKTVNLMLRRFMEESGDVEGLERMNKINPDEVAMQMGQQQGGQPPGPPEAEAPTEPMEA